MEIDEKVVLLRQELNPHGIQKSINAKADSDYVDARFRDCEAQIKQLDIMASQLDHKCVSLTRIVKQMVPCVKDMMQRNQDTMAARRSNCLVCGRRDFSHERLNTLHSPNVHNMQPTAQEDRLLGTSELPPSFPKIAEAKLHKDSTSKISGTFNWLDVRLPDPSMQGEEERTKGKSRRSVSKSRSFVQGLGPGQGQGQGQLSSNAQAVDESAHVILVKKLKQPRCATSFKASRKYNLPLSYQVLADRYLRCFLYLSSYLYLIDISSSFHAYFGCSYD